MKATDLMIGDWILASGKPIRATLSSLLICARVHFRPIPLTPEILENNGIKPDDTSDGSYRITKGMTLCIDISTDGCFLCAGYNELEDINIYIGVRYVHELQHALKLCGIDKEIIMKPNQKIVDELFGEEQDKTSLIQIGNLKIRFLYDPCILIDDWKNFSIHVDYKGHNKGNFHIAYRKKWPFIKIGFRNIYPNLYNGGGF